MKNKNFLFIVTFVFLLIIFGRNITEPVAASTNGLVAMIFGSGAVLGDEDEDEQEDEDEDEEEDEAEDEDEDEQEDEDEDEEEQESHSSEEQIQNANGSTTYIKRQEEAGKVEVEVKTYDQTGRLLEERKLKDEGQELQLEKYVYNSGDLKELKVKTKAGKELEVTVKESVDSKEPSKLEYKVNEQELKIKFAGNKNLFIKPKSGYLEINDGVLGARVELPLTVDSGNGEVFVETLVGLVKLGISPQKAKEILEEEANFNYSQEDIDLVEGGNGLEYKITSKKREKLLWFIPVSVGADYTVDAETGEFTGVDQSLLAKILDLVSF